jgi:hypothetical protein
LDNLDGKMDNEGDTETIKDYFKIFVEEPLAMA